MKWKIYSARASFDGFSKEWDELNERLYGDHPFFASAFQGSLVRHFADSRTKLAVLDSTAGPAALVLFQPARATVWQLFRPVTAQIAPVLIDRVDRERMQALFRSLPGVPLLIDWVCQDPLYTQIKVSDDSHLSVQHALTMTAEYAGSFDDYWSARPRSLRRNMRSYFGKLEALGPYCFLEFTDTHELLAALERYGLLESKGWKGAAGTALHPENIQGRFYADVLRQFGEKGRAKVSELRLNDEVIASRLFVEGPTMSVALKTTYDEGYASVAPGRILLHEILRRGFQEQAGKKLEFYTNASKDQLQWATSQRTIEDVSYFRSRTVRRLVDAMKRLKSKSAPTGHDESRE